MSIQAPTATSAREPGLAVIGGGQAGADDWLLPALDGRTVTAVGGQVCTRRPAKPCRVPAYDCCEEDAAN